jgi:signal transduction histidine kinase
VLDYAFSPLPDGSTLATVADVTDSVNVARALRDRNTALEEADRLKNAFIEHVSYELRSPLNTIIGFTQLLTRPETGALTEKQREYADYISASSEALLVIIDGVLDLATIDAGIMELSVEPVDVDGTLRQVLDGLKDRIAEASLEIRTEIADDAATFEADAQRVRQVLFNLVSNAVSHSPPEGVITIAARRDGEFVALSVRDRGPGIAEDRVEAVFERFHTAGAPGRRGGVGLGLSLVKGFVELHGGTVEVAHVEGPGAELVVRFPRRQADRAPVRHAA